MKNTRACLTTATVLAAACGGATRTPAPAPVVAATAELPACPLPDTGTPEQPWRLVQGQGFTFCVPPTYGPAEGMAASNATRWVSRDGSIGWMPRTPQIVSREQVVMIPPGRRHDDLGEMQRATSSACAPRRGPETIDGHAATVTAGACSGRFFSSAEFRTPVLTFSGSANNQSTAEQQLAIYRTIRFTASTRP